MGIKNLFKNLTSGGGLSDADIATLRMPAIAAAAAAYVTAAFVAGPVSKVVLTLTALPVTMVKNGTTSAGAGVQLLQFQQGYVKPAGCTSNLVVAGSGSISVVAALGTAAAATDGTLTSTEANVAASTAATLTSGAGTCKFKQDATTAIDGTSSALAVYLNAALNADATGNEALTFTGTITLLFSDLGDN